LLLQIFLIKQAYLQKKKTFYIFKTTVKVWLLLCCQMSTHSHPNN